MVYTGSIEETNVSMTRPPGMSPVRKGSDKSMQTTDQHARWKVIQSKRRWNRHHCFQRWTLDLAGPHWWSLSTTERIIVYIRALRRSRRLIFFMPPPSKSWASDLSLCHTIVVKNYATIIIIILFNVTLFFSGIELLFVVPTCYQQ